MDAMHLAVAGPVHLVVVTATLQFVKLQGFLHKEGAIRELFNSLQARLKHCPEDSRA